jgi:hypothetical protein
MILSRSTRRCSTPLFQFLWAVVVLLMVAGCARPEQSEFRDAIGASLKERIPFAMGGCMTGSADVVVDSLEVLKVGRLSGTIHGTGYPVLVRASGSYVPLFGDVALPRQAFDGTGEFVVGQDAYGEWRAVPMRP